MTDERMLELIQPPLRAGLDKLVSTDDHTGLVTIDFEEAVSVFLLESPVELLEAIVAKRKESDAPA